MKFGYGSDIITTGLTVKKRWTIEDYLRKIADIGYDCASLFCWRGLQAQPQYLKSEDRKQILSLLDEVNITISLIGGYGGLMLTTDYGYFSHDRAEREYVKSYMKQCVDLAVDLKCDVVGEISSIKPSYMKEEKAWEILETELGEVCDYAQENYNCEKKDSSEFIALLACLIKLEFKALFNNILQKSNIPSPLIPPPAFFLIISILIFYTLRYILLL